MTNYKLDLGLSIIPDQYDSIQQRQAQKKYQRSIITLVAALVLFVGFLIMTAVNPHQLGGGAAPFGIIGMVITPIAAGIIWASIRSRQNT